MSPERIKCGKAHERKHKSVIEHAVVIEKTLSNEKNVVAVRFHANLRRRI